MNSLLKYRQVLKQSWELLFGLSRRFQNFACRCQTYQTKKHLIAEQGSNANQKEKDCWRNQFDEFLYSKA